MNTEKDKAVSDAYRATATEKTPEHLDRAVLAEARRAVRPGYARSRAWTRPLAWAATVVLSVAIVLELTQTPEPNGVGADVAAPAAAPETEPVEAKTEPVEAKKELVEAKKEPGRISADDFAVQDKDMMRRAERADQVQYSEEKARVSLAAMAPASPVCPEDATGDPEKWLACIEALEAEGLMDEAAEQKRLLLDAFPDFELP